MDRDADTPRTGAGHVTVTPGQLAAARGVSERTVRRWITKGALPSGMTAEQTPDGWRIAVPDARVLDCLTLNDVTGQMPDSADTVSQALQARIAALESELAAARERETWLRGRVERPNVRQRIIRFCKTGESAKSYNAEADDPDDDLAAWARGAGGGRSGGTGGTGAVGIAGGAGGEGAAGLVATAVRWRCRPWAMTTDGPCRTPRTSWGSPAGRCSGWTRRPEHC